MGRTNPTYRDALRAIEERWQEYRRALRRRDQSKFDQLFTYAREHADASGLLNHENPLLPALLSIDLVQEARLDAQEERIAELEAELRSVRDEDPTHHDEQRDETPTIQNAEESPGRSRTS